jgi:hypothetical protein
MSATAAITCPNCDNPLNVPPQYFGKKIKCKHCGHAFVVQDPDEGTKPTKPTKPAKPGAKPAAATSPPPPPVPESEMKPTWDAEDEEAAGGMAKPLAVVPDDTDVPRCPHCAQELDPPDAIVCVHCGFNNRTRAKADTKKVWAPTAEDWFMHLLPGIIALAIVIGLIVLNVISSMRMRDWLDDTFLEMDEKDAAGRKRFYIAPGAFIFFIAAVSLVIFIPAVKFAFKRLVREYRPTERIKL